MSFSFRNLFSADDSEFEFSKGTSSFPEGGGERSGGEESSPFAPPFQTFLASELLPYIPKAIAALSGIPMEKEVRVPLSADGGLDVPLSSIYRVCPELFAAEITPLNDSVVTLPPRLGATPDFAPVTSEVAAPFGGIQGKRAAGFFAQSEEWTGPIPPKFNPFQPKSPPPAESTVFSASPEAPGTDPFGAGFEGSAFSWHADDPGSGKGGQGPGSDDPSPGSMGEDSPSFDSGESAPALFSRRAGDDEPEARPADPDPSGSEAPLFQGRPDDEEEATQGVWGAMFQTAPRQEEEPDHAPGGPVFASIGNLLKQGLPGSASPAQTSPQNGESGPAAGPEGTPPQIPAPVEPATVVTHVGVGTVPALFPDPATPPAFPSTSPMSSSFPAETPVPSTSAQAPTGDDERDLELRAIFSTSEAFDFAKTARLVADLPGIRSCSLATPANQAHASRLGENRSGEEVREMVSAVRSLAKLTGLPDARTFTLQTERGVVSLFLEGESCVAVQQESAAFAPGVREKLILVARNLVKLRE